KVALISLAIECTFWTEKTPEGLLHLGPTIIAEGQMKKPDEWTQQIATALEQTQDSLAEAAISRDPARFNTLISGRSGIGGIYDVWRRATSLLLGKSFSAGHADVGMNR